MRRLFAAFVVLALATQVFATPVLADANCDSGEFCVYGEINYNACGCGDFWDPGTDDNDWDWWGIENDDDSVKNRESSQRVIVYAGANYTGGYQYCTNPGEVEDDIAENYDNNGDSNDHQSLTSCGTLRHP